MFAYFWLQWLYTPLLNLLVYLYNTVAAGSLGFAVIWLTVIIRIALLPISIVAEGNALAYDRLQMKIRAIEKESRTDPVLQKERIRELLKKNRVNPWAKAAVLGLQLLVLVLLYQVFLGGITAKLDALYPFMDRPDTVNTIFFGVELGVRNIWWALAAAVYLFVDIALSMRRRAHVERSDLTYLIIFPLFTFFILWYLPMVKSVFILTTLIFSTILGMIRMAIFKATKA